MRHALDIEVDRLMSQHGVSEAEAKKALYSTLLRSAAGPAALRRLRSAEEELGGGSEEPKERQPFPGTGGSPADRDPVILDLENRLKELDQRRAQIQAPGLPSNDIGNTDLIGRAREIYHDKFGTFGPKATRRDRTIANTRRIFDALIEASTRQMPDDPARARQLGIARAVSFLQGREGPARASGLYPDPVAAPPGAEGLPSLPRCLAATAAGVLQR